MEELDREFLEFFQAATSMQGLDSSVGTIFGVLFLEPKEISMEELAEKTGYSPASICNKVKMLEPSGMIRRVRKPHTKKVLLYAEKDFSKIISSYLLMKQKSVISLGKDKLPGIIKRYKAKKLGEEQKKKLSIMEHYYQDLIQFEVMVNMMLKKIEEMHKIHS
jgi:DNA-binding transcriptional regulator GbsR (MarR family)